MIRPWGILDIWLRTNYKPLLFYSSISNKLDEFKDEVIEIKYLINWYEKE
jgi:hypothetical protein